MPLNTIGTSSDMMYDARFMVLFVSSSMIGPSFFVLHAGT